MCDINLSPIFIKYRNLKQRVMYPKHLVYPDGEGGREVQLEQIRASLSQYRYTEPLAKQEEPDCDMEMTVAYPVHITECVPLVKSSDKRHMLLGKKPDSQQQIARMLKIENSEIDEKLEELFDLPPTPPPAIAAAALVKQELEEDAIDKQMEELMLEKERECLSSSIQEKENMPVTGVSYPFSPSLTEDRSSTR